MNSRQRGQLCRDLEQEGHGTWEGLKDDQHGWHGESYDTRLGRPRRRFRQGLDHVTELGVYSEEQ